MGQGTKVLVGLSLALFCALWLFGAARNQTKAQLAGSASAGIEVIPARLGSVEEQEPAIEEIVVEAEAITETDNINLLRLSALVAQNENAWFDAVDIWIEVTGHPDAGLDDFLALAHAYEQVNDPALVAETLNRICVKFPDQPEGYLALGGLRERQGNINEARFQYQVGLSYCPDDSALQEGLTRIDTALDAAGQPESPLPIEWTPQETVPEIIEPDSGPGDPTAQSVIVQPETPDEDPGAGEDESKTDVEEPRETGPIVLIGEADTGESDNQDGGGIAEEDEEDAVEITLIGISDMNVTAVPGQVTIELVTDQPAPFSSSRSTDPPRLFIRIPNAMIAEGAAIVRSMNLNVPLVDRITLIENTENNAYVSLIIYLGEGTRHSIASNARSITITIASVPDQEDAGVDQ